ncbi:MAG: zinc ribbon domain-containing protein [Planctomycetaceae bacterium]
MAGMTEALASLHRLHMDLHEVNEGLARGPRQVKVKQRKVTETQDEATRLKAELKETRAAADRKSLELKSREAKLADLQGKLNLASNNREYDVLRGQIEADEVANSVLEDEILELLEKVDATQVAIGETEGKVKELQTECEKFESQVSATATELKTKGDDLSRRIQAAEPALSGENLLRYRRLIEAYGAEGMAGVDNKGICTHCFVALIPQSQVQVKCGDAIFCSNCGRLLYQAE